MNSFAKPSTVQKKKFCDKDFFSKCEQIHAVFCSHLLKKSLT